MIDTTKINEQRKELIKIADDLKNIDTLPPLKEVGDSCFMTAITKVD